MAFSTSLSGINAANADLNVTSHNIANVNTVGFKESRAEFADIFQTSHYGLTRNAIGSGVRLSQVSQQFKPGPINGTGRNLDLAISGEGFFTLRANDDGYRVYSRAGNFFPDANGFVINPQGANLQVFPPNNNGGFDVGQLVDLQLGRSVSPPKPTETVTLAFTLPAGAATPAVTPFDKDDANTYNYSSGGVTVYDSLGVPHIQSSYFVKTGTPADNTWEVYSFIDGNLVSATPADLEFDGSGALTTPPPPATIALDPYTPPGANPMQLSLNITNSVQLGTAFALNTVGQDGYALGKLNEIEIDSKGVVYARYSNNADVALGQIALAMFPSSQGLQQQGNNVWEQTGNSGDARLGAPDSADFGRILGGSLEGSSVELTEQMVNMIVAQRNFQANAQMLSTQDQVTQTILNMR